MVAQEAGGTVADDASSAESAIRTEAAALLAIPLAAPKEDGEADTDARHYGPAAKTFIIATWHLGAQDPAAPEVEEPVTAWRHTFGSERRTARWRQIKAAGFAADIVALQGVHAPAQAWRLFEARTHQVVVSRQLLARSNAQSTGITVFRDAAPATTALSYRRQRGVRLAGFRHFLPDAGATRADGKETAAITAFRLNVYGKMIWIASLDVAEDCAARETAPDCAGARGILGDFAAWIGNLDDGIAAPIVLLGRWPATLEAAIKAAGFRIGQLAGDGRPDCQPRGGKAALAVPEADIDFRADLQAKAAPEGSAKCARLARLEMILRPPQAAAARGSQR